MKDARIQQLPSAVANQIAAGEVIERPASVVKELLENALDAGADTISVEIGFGGLNQIKIADNGAGIIADDLPLAIAAHATSKIRQLNDLYAITSMGFRGEALASIASVAKLSLSSKPASQDHAMLLSVEGGMDPLLTPCARNKGTTVEVRDLFFNAPVRKKFLKTPRSEYQAIELVVKRFALSEPSLTLTLKQDGKEVFYLPRATDEKTKLLRIKKLLGKAFVDNAIYVDLEQGGLHLQGWLSGPNYQRSQNDKQWVYINQRMVKDKLINHAIKQAYDDILYPGRYPSCLLYLTIKAAEVDVNVHPTKHEVRFQQPRLVHDFIVSTITNGLTTFKSQPVSKSEIPLINLNPVETREVFIKHPVQAAPRYEKTTTANWIMLNKQFGLLFLQEQPYLIDLVNAQRSRYLSLIHQTPLPLAHRPLLVPISHPINNSERPIIEQYKMKLESFGIHFDWIGEGTIVIRTIPLALPQLDLKKLIHAIITRGSGDLSALLVGCQSMDAQQLNSEEKMLLADHVSLTLSLPSISSLWCIRLDAETCGSLFRSQQHA